MKFFSVFGLSILSASAHDQRASLAELQKEPFLRQMIENLQFVHKAMNFTQAEEELSSPAYFGTLSSNLDPAEAALIKRMVKFSAAAYCPDLTLKHWKCTHCRALGDSSLVSVISDSITEGKGYVALDHSLKTIVVAFRGSYNIRNWITDFNFGFKELDVGDGTRGLKTHTGFINHANAMSQKMIPIIKPLLAKYKYSLTITGHSLGAAIATLTSINFKNELNLPWSEVNLVTYGEPRIGNPAFATWYNTNNPGHLRVVNNRDMVPHLPATIQGFLHRKREIFLKHNSMRSCTGPDMEDFSCSLSVLPNLSFLDHLFYFDVTFGLIC